MFQIFQTKKMCTDRRIFHDDSGIVPYNGCATLQIHSFFIADENNFIIENDIEVLNEVISLSNTWQMNCAKKSRAIAVSSASA